jgi:hypothetical protein
MTAIFSLFSMFLAFYLSVIIGGIILAINSETTNVLQVFTTGIKTHFLGFSSLLLVLFTYKNEPEIVQKRFNLEQVNVREDNSIDLIESFLIYLFPELTIGIFFIVPVIVIARILLGDIIIQIESQLLIDIIYIYLISLGLSIGINLCRITVYFSKE